MNVRAETVPLRLIAERAKVSRMTVSLALRNSPALPLATRNRIKEVARELGYRPDPEISRLMAKIRERRKIGHKNSIAFLTAHDKRSAWKEYATQRHYHDGAARRAEEYGYTLEEFWLREPKMTEKRLSEIIRSRGIEGVIVAPIPKPGPLFQDFRWEYFSAVALGYSLVQPWLHRACSHQYQCMLLALHKLTECGYRRIGLAMELQQDVRANHNWRAGFLVGKDLWSRGRTIPALITEDWRIDRFERWLDCHQPDVIVTAGGEVHEWLRKLGKRVPQAVAVCNVNVEPHMAGITGINQHSPLIGAASVDLLISLLYHDERGIPAVPRLSLVEGTFTHGRTAPPMRKTRPVDTDRLSRTARS